MYQRLIFSGYGSRIPDGTYRIIDIQYNMSAQGSKIKNEVTVTVILDSVFQAYYGTMHIFINPVQEVTNIAKNILGQSTTPIAGVLTSISSWQPVITFIKNSVFNYVVTMAALGAAPPFTLGATATITGIVGTTVTFTISGTSYSGYCAKASALRNGNTGTVTAVNGTVTFNTTDLGSGQSYIQTGYTANAKALSVGQNVTATPDQNGRWIVTPG